MSETDRLPADITIAVDDEGVIRTAIGARSLAHEALDGWLGRSWLETIAPGGAEGLMRAVEPAAREGQSASFVCNQRLPSGRELLLEFTTVRLSAGSGFVAIGRSIQATSDLRNRLAAVQHEREQDYWKLREIETRYRALLEAAPEAVALVRVGTLRVIEANALAAKTFGLVPGAECFHDLPEREHKALDALLETARTKGTAPRIVLRFTAEGPVSLRASILTSEAGAFYLLQFSPLADSRSEAALRSRPAWSLDSLVRRLPQPFFVADRDGVVRSANHAFVDLVQAEVDTDVVGKDAARWLSLPGTGMRQIIDRVERRGVVQSLRTRLVGAKGANAEVEVAAVGDRDDAPEVVAVLVRPISGAPAVVADAVPEAPASPLGAEVRTSVEALERRRLRDALAKSGGNRTLAAQILGVSRQNLHAKLKKYGL